MLSTTNYSKRKNDYYNYFAVSLLTASVVYVGEDRQPDLLFGDSGQTIEETNKLLSVALTEVGFDLMGHYAPLEYPERHVL